MHFRFLRYFKYFFFLLYTFYSNSFALGKFYAVQIYWKKKKKSEFTNIKKIFQLNKILELKLLVCFRYSKVS